MRNPDRIEPFMNKLGKLWKEQCPDWRFGQLISNLENYTIYPDLFYVEDDEFIKIAEDFFNMK